jgi:hypothetical protein
VAELYGQHTAETGQAFLPKAIERACEVTGGQPREVNALAHKLTQVVAPDPKQPIASAHVEMAKEIHQP